MARARHKKHVTQSHISADEVLQGWRTSADDLPDLTQQQLNLLRERIEAAIKSAAEAERAACLQIAEQEVEVWADIASDGGQEAARGIANFIRERNASS
jgi:hypothetical protein